MESVQDEIHTRSLLFPDADALQNHQHDQVYPLPTTSMPALSSSALSFDINPDIDLEIKDVRCLIMQQQTAMVPAQLLYDSHAPPISDKPTVSEMRPPVTLRRISAGASATLDQRQGMFGGRRPSDCHKRTSSIAETEGQKVAREYREEVSLFADCMFGSSEIMADKRSGTKVHPLPSVARTPSPSQIADGGASFGKANMRSSRLAQSFTSDSIMSASVSSVASRSSDRKRVLITRIFPVPLMYNEQEEAEDGYPFPTVNTNDAIQHDYISIQSSQKVAPKEKEKPKQRRTPAYAIGLVINLPAVRSRSLERSIISVGSYTDQESLPSSISSSKPHGWTVLGDGFGGESLESSVILDPEDEIDIVTQHWDVIVRTMSNLQAVTTVKIHALLQQVDNDSPKPRPKSRTVSISVSGKRVEQPVFKKSTYSKMVNLNANALAKDRDIENVTETARSRIVYGLKTLQVVTRQGRWGIWRDEARLADKWAGGKDTGFFFYNLMTAFLGTHKDWLQALAPQFYKRRFHQVSKSSKDDDLPIVARTIIIGTDKMAIRRLIFLLAAFLAPNQQQQLPYSRSYRPSTSMSFGGYSQSPPSYMANRDESLRRKVNRRKPAHARTQSFQSPTLQDHERRNSELKTANLPIPGSDGGTRKSSAATTTTITPVNTIPHFSTLQRSVRGTGPIPRPGSSGSFATDDLIKYNLKRGDSSGQQSFASTDSQGSKWGSWGARVGLWQRQDSSSTTDVAVEEEERPPSKLDAMVEEAASFAAKPVVTYDIPTPPPKVPLPVPYEASYKTSVDDDGVIEVDVPLPDLSTYGSVISSPSSSGYLSLAPGLEGFENFSIGRDADTPLNVGGWLPKFHPDFSLQGIPPQEDLEKEVKDWMRTEPTPTLSKSFEQGWVDVSTTLIADTMTFTIKCIKYRRFVTAISVADVRDGVATAETQLQKTTLNGQPGADSDDNYLEDFVVSVDPLLTDAIEKILDHSSPSPLVSGASSTSKEHFPQDLPDGTPTTMHKTRSDSNETQKVTRDTEHLEVPRIECKKHLLGALEAIVKQVVDARQDGKNASREDIIPRIDSGLVKNDIQFDSVLKEGVAAWLAALE